MPKIIRNPAAYKAAIERNKTRRAQLRAIDAKHCKRAASVRRILSRWTS
jgi:hypothetical protein